MQLVYSATILLTVAINAKTSIDPFQRLSTSSISIETTNERKWTGFATNQDRSGYQRIGLWRHLPNMMSEDVSMSVGITLESHNVDFLLDKKKSDDLERTRALPPSEWEKKNIAERGVQYNKHYVDYIAGLKCTTNVDAANLALGVANKKYYTVCGYYDTAGAKKRIDIFYKYMYTHSGTKSDGDKQSSSVTPETMQQQFKQDMKAIFDSLVIHDMDRERMSKEGLLYDKVYEIQEW